MSPVSRGRKPKKSKKSSSAKGRRHPGRATVAALEQAVRLFEGPDRDVAPAWFAPAVDAALDDVDRLLAAQGPGELEQAATELIGAQLHARLHSDNPDGLWFDWWTGELATTAADRVLQTADQPASGAWRAPWRLLHALLSIGTPPLTAHTRTEIDRCAPALGPLGDLPSWLSLMPRVKATGELWQLRDAYGTRRAVIAAYTYPDGLDHHVFLFDHDLSGHGVRLVAPDAFTDVEEASAAWRSRVGATADHAATTPVDDPADVQALVQIDLGDRMLMGSEPAEVLDNWFRARRRIDDLATTLGNRNTPLPEPQDLFDQGNTDTLVEEFTAWHTTEHRSSPDTEAVEALAAQWVEDVLPETRYLVSPRRLHIQRELLGDWIPTDPITITVKTLLPRWAAWLAERAELPPHLVERVVAAAQEVQEQSN